LLLLDPTFGDVEAGADHALEQLLASVVLDEPLALGEGGDCIAVLASALDELAEEGDVAGRPTKLTPEVQRKLCASIRIGASYEEAAIASGISERTFAYWRRRAETAADVLPPGWKKLPLARILVMAEDLEVDEADVVPTGAKGKRTREDWVRALEDAEGKFQRLFHAMAEAKVHGKIIHLDRIDKSSKGGQRIVKTKTKVVKDMNGKVIARSEETIEYETLPSSRDSKWILARTHGMEKGSLDDGGKKSPREIAREIQRAVREAKGASHVED
jgi:hypothetical protein